MTALPDLTPEVRAEIARLCGGEFREGSLRTGGDYWHFPASKFGVLVRDWLSHNELAEAANEAMCESILLRGLARAGVLVNLYPQNDHEWRACYVDTGAVVFVKGPTPIAALVALAAAHLEDRKEGGK